MNKVFFIIYKNLAFIKTFNGITVSFIKLKFLQFEQQLWRRM